MKNQIDFERIAELCRAYPVSPTEEATMELCRLILSKTEKVWKSDKKEDNQHFKDLRQIFRRFCIFNRIKFPFELWAEVVQQGVPILREYVENPHLGPLKDRRGFAEWTVLYEEVSSRLARDPKYSEMFFILMDLW